MLVFRYDKSFDGLLSALFDAYSMRAFPEALIGPGEPEPLFTERVHDDVGPPGQIVQLLPAQEAGDGGEADLAVDLADVFPRGVGLVHADASLGTQKLTVEIGRLERIAVRRHDGAYAHAGEHVEHMPPEPAETDEQRPAPRQSRLLRFRQQAVPLVPFREHGASLAEVGEAADLGRGNFLQHVALPNPTSFPLKTSVRGDDGTGDAEGRPLPMRPPVINGMKSSGKKRDNLGSIGKDF